MSTKTLAPRIASQAMLPALSLALCLPLAAAAQDLRAAWRPSPVRSTRTITTSAPTT